MLSSILNLNLIIQLIKNVYIFFTLKLKIKNFKFNIEYSYKCLTLVYFNVLKIAHLYSRFNFFLQLLITFDSVISYELFT